MSVDSVIKYNDITKLREPSVHFTIIFNVFIMMTLFNEFNSRKIHEERNIFSGLSKNPYFLIIWIICFASQVFIVCFGGVVFAVQPLDLDHWMWCIFLGLGSLLWNQIILTIPNSIVRKFLNKVLFWRKKKLTRLVKKMSEKGVIENVLEEEEIKPEDMFDEDNEEDLEAAEKEFLEKSKSIWVRGASRISNQVRNIFMTVIKPLKIRFESIQSRVNFRAELNF
jgi:Ca2+ transporting ATPase